MQGIIVGGSLAGLASAIALDRVGVEVTLLEKKDRMPGTVGGLGVQTVQPGDSDLARFLKNLIVNPQERALAFYGHVAKQWEEIYQTYLAYLGGETSVKLHHGVRVLEVGQDHAGVYAKAQGQVYTGDIIVGADGHQSLVRAQVDPSKPDATYAGYLNWGGRVHESLLPPAAQQVDTVVGYEYVLQGPGKILIGFIQPGDQGSTQPGERYVAFGQYDAWSNHIARRLGALVGDKAMFSVQGADLSEEEVQGLIDRTQAQPWPEPFQSAMLHALSQRAVRGILLKEYVPDKLVEGRMALVGDAGHVATSWTGMGFNASLQDAASLANHLAQSTHDVPGALKSYEADRLAPVRRIVQGGQDFSRSFREEEF